ncbi:inner-membrane translocator [Mesorhizobium sp. M2E.F.Ca.ET.166.01.1.1]|nr:inner-membrane translocator [Mesorhizobium sp. M2E.F.Ca.ET.219.01.1.1]TGT65606.1 inner-membrane translocator [Mesorhizobium sp. M2E.F.Ca.ET.166.01.1.1]TGV97653.1 inner-membrane translocator [Mesorhizobium sp. M2E.F.Ca.ET.154.01.1.1]
MQAMNTTRQQVSVTTAPAKISFRQNLLEALSTKWRVVPVLLSLALIWAIFASQSPVFLSARNLTNLADQIATTSIVALGLVLVLVVAEIDLSVAGLAAVCAGIVGVLVVNMDVSLSIALIIAITVGGLYGLLQGSMIVYSGAPAFIVTLGFSLMLQGVLLILLPAESGLVPLAGTDLQFLAAYRLPTTLSYALPAAVGLIGLAMRLNDHRQRVAYGLPSNLMRSMAIGVAIIFASLAVVAIFNAYRGVPLTVAVLAGLIAILSYATTQTPFGIWLYAIGGNREAARRAGIPVNWMKMAAFSILGMLTALGGVVAAARVLGVSPASADQSLLLEAIAAAVIGGTSLFGGRGSVWAAILGALVIGSIANGMFLINASTQLRLLVQGGVLVAAVIADALIARSGSSSSR